MQAPVCHFINCHIAGCIVFSMSYYINSYPKQMTYCCGGFTKEQTLELCYIAYPWAQEMIDSGECTKEEQDEGFLENPVMFPFPWENWTYYNSQPKPTFKRLKKWVESRVHITGRC